MLTAYEKRILRNLYAEKHHFDGFAYSGKETIKCMTARINLLQRGLIARKGEKGFARIQFDLTDAGHQAIDEARDVSRGV